MLNLVLHGSNMRSCGATRMRMTVGNIEVMFPVPVSYATLRSVYSRRGLDVQ